MEILTDFTLNEKDKFYSILKKAKTIYEHYCQYGDRMNYSSMTTFKYIKLFTECGVIPLVEKIQLELIYKAESKSNTMTFSQFLNTLIPIGKLVYSSEGLTGKKATTRLMHQFLIPQTRKLTSDYLNMRIPSIESEMQKKSVSDMFTVAAPLFFEIYTAYFKHEISICDQMAYIKEESMKKYNRLIRDLEITPGMISKTLSLKIYQSETCNEEVDYFLSKKVEYYISIMKRIDLEAIRKRDPKNSNILGQHFTFFKLLRAMAKIASVSFQLIGLDTREAEVFNKQTETFTDKLTLFLQKIELSKGFVDLQRKSAKNRNSNTYSFFYDEQLQHSKESDKDIDVLPSNQIYSRNYQQPQKSTNQHNSQKSIEDIVMGRSFNYNTQSNKVDLFIYHNNLKDLCTHSDYINSKYGEELLGIFDALCKYGDIFNRKRLRSKQFVKMLLDCSLVNLKDGTLHPKDGCNRIEPNAIDTLFIKLCNLRAYEVNESSEKQTQLRNFSSSTFPDLSHLNNSVCLNNGTFLQTALNESNTSFKAPINSSMSINFEGFIIGLEALAHIVYPKKPIKEGINTLIKQRIIPQMLKLAQKPNEIEIIIEQLTLKKDSNRLQQLLLFIESNFLSVFNYYSEEKELFYFNQFKLFATDFNFFPSAISMKKLKECFSYLSQSLVFPNEHEQELEVIDYCGFINLLCLCGVMSNKEDDIDCIDKIILFIDKLIISEGVNKIRVKEGMRKIHHLNVKQWLLDNKLKSSKAERYSKKAKEKETFVDLFFKATNYE